MAAVLLVALTACTGVADVDDGAINAFERAGLAAANGLEIVEPQDDGSQVWVTVSNEEEIAAITGTLDAPLARRDSSVCATELEVHFYTADGDMQTVWLGCDALRLHVDGAEAVLEAPTEFESSIERLLAALPRP